MESDSAGSTEHVLGAHFRIDDGFCFVGPCAGARLIGISVRIEDGNVIIPGTLPRPGPDAQESHD